jgi:hypothetical protein
MSAKHLSRNPHHIDNHAWWYEENGGIVIIQDTEQPAKRELKIRWSAIRAALKRKDKK